MILLNFIKDATPESELPDEKSEADSARQEIKEVFQSPPFVGNVHTVTGDLYKVSEDKFAELFSFLLENFSERLNLDQLEAYVEDLKEFKEADQKLDLFKRLTESEKKLMVTKDPDLYDGLIVVGKSLIELNALKRQESTDLNEGKSLPRQELSNETGTLSRIESRTNSDFLNQLEGFHSNGNLLSTSNSSLILDRGGREMYCQEIQEYEYVPSPGGEASDMHNFFTPSKMSEGEKQYSQVDLLANQIEKPIFYSRGSGKALASTKNSLDKDDSSSYPFSASPPEQIQKYHYWAGFVLSLVSIYFSNQAALAVLRRLNFTEEWVKGMVGKGWPRWLLFWLRVDKPGQLTEYALFHFMMCILPLNLIILQIVVKML